MSRAKASGYSLTKEDARIVMGMVSRGDRDHDIAAWFGVNQGRIAEVKDGKFGNVVAADASQLPPKGPPGVKGRRLRAAVEKAIKVLESSGPNAVQDTLEILRKAAKIYDSNEP